MSKLVRLASWFALLLPISVVNASDAAPLQFDKFYMVFLMRGDQPPALDEKAASELQASHLAHLDRLWREGFALIAGPFGGDKDDPLRGIVLFRGDLDIEKVRELASADPAVEAGRLKVDVRPWYTGAGYLAFPKQPE